METLPHLGQSCIAPPFLGTRDAATLDGSQHRTECHPGDSSSIQGKRICIHFALCPLTRRFANLTCPRLYRSSESREREIGDGLLSDWHLGFLKGAALVHQPKLLTKAFHPRPVCMRQLAPSIIECRDPNLY